MDSPPVDPQAHCAAPAHVSVQQAQRILADMRSKLVATQFESAQPAPICGLTALRLENGNTMFTDKTQRYLVIGLMLDTATGKTLDGEKQLNSDKGLTP